MFADTLIINCNYMKIEEIVKEILMQVDIDEYFKNIKVEELIEVIFNLKEK